MDHHLPADNNHRPASARDALKKLLPSVFEDILLPYGAYKILKYYGVSEPIALAAGGSLSFIRVLYGIARSRRIDLMALLMLVMFALTIVTSLVTGHKRLSIDADSLYTGLAGLALLGSLFWGQPLMYVLARKQLQARATPEPASLRPRMKRITAVWGGVLVTEASLRIGLVLILPIKVMTWVSPGLMGVSIAGLFLWTRIYNRNAAPATDSARP